MFVNGSRTRPRLMREPLESVLLTVLPLGEEALLSDPPPPVLNHISGAVPLNIS